MIRINVKIMFSANVYLNKTTKTHKNMLGYIGAVYRDKKKMCHAPIFEKCIKITT